MRKGQKLKRYGNIYASPVRKTKRARNILGVVCLVLLVLAGWLIYPPVRDFLLAEDLEQQSSSSKPAEKEYSSTPPNQEPSVVSSLPPVVAPVDKPSVDDYVSGIYLPASSAVSADYLEGQLKNAKAGKMNTVLIEAKDANGIVHFDTENNVALSAKAVADDAYSAAKVSQTIHDSNMLAAARIHAFRDPVASRSVKAMAVTYGNSETRWLDNSADLGGKSWLNPCSPKAQEYIISLAVELVDAGFDEIILDSVQFPSGVSLDKAGYGLNGSFSRRGILKDFIAEITKAVESAGGKVAVCIPADSIELENPSKALARANTSIYGGSPELIAPENGVLVFSEGNAYDEVLAKAKANAPETVWAVSIPNTAPDGTAVSVDKSEFENTNGYFIYNPQGTYIFN